MSSAATGRSGTSTSCVGLLQPPGSFSSRTTIASGCIKSSTPLPSALSPAISSALTACLLRTACDILARRCTMYSSFSVSDNPSTAFLSSSPPPDPDIAWTCDQIFLVISRTEPSILPRGTTTISSKIWFKLKENITITTMTNAINNNPCNSSLRDGSRKSNSTCQSDCKPDAITAMFCARWGASNWRMLRPGMWSTAPSKGTTSSYP
mmetsp:Transcript_16891/g.40723  ORF Transcript_16891/g.40723 Transcript_16891/m.40723 type:complete len:208 (+) Transcript_16891:1074-1697(+)